MATPRLGASLDLFDINNPVIELRLSEQDAENLRAFLQNAQVGTTHGTDADVYTPVYKELMSAQQRLRTVLLAAAERQAEEAKQTAERGEHLRLKAAAYRGFYGG